jgi:hypothetical protein
MPPICNHSFVAGRPFDRKDRAPPSIDHVVDGLETLFQIGSLSIRKSYRA